jgi:hypothetical protein
VYSRHRFCVLSNRGDLPEWLDLSRFDGVVVHFTLIASNENFLSAAARRRIGAFRGFKAAFVQDEYRWINATTAALSEMRLTALFTTIEPHIMDAVYPPARLPGVRRETVLTGYVSEAMTRMDVPPYEARAIDVGYRARKLPAWLGSSGQLKWQIADRFAADAARFDLAVDLSWREEDRLYGDGWVRFLSGCKAVLGTESGASVMDFTGDIQRSVEAHEQRDPAVSFATLREQYFKNVDGQVVISVISPRCFEAAALRTLMILYESTYSGALRPWRHYVPLALDHSNMADVARVVKDPEAAKPIIDAAYREVALNPAYSYKGLAERVDAVIAEEYAPPSPAPYGYSPGEWAWRLGSEPADFTLAAAAIFATPPLDSGAHPTALIRPEPDRATQQSRPGEAPPHHLQIDLWIPVRILAVHLVWATPHSAVRRGRLECFRAGRRVRDISIDVAISSQHIRIGVPDRGSSIDRIRLTFLDYHDGTMMRLQDVRIDARLTLPDRFRAWREQAGIRFLYSIGSRWMDIPAPVRRALQRPIRATYDAVFGRR